MKRVLFNKRGMVFMGFAILFGFILFSAIVLSGVVSGGLFGRMDGLGLMPESFSNFGSIKAAFDELSLYEGGIEKLFEGEFSSDDLKELAEAGLTDGQLKLISDTFEGKANNENYNEFLKELTNVKMGEGKTLKTFDVANSFVGSVKIEGDLLRVVDSEGNEMASLSMNDVLSGLSINIDEDGNVKVSKDELSITTDEGIVRGFEVDAKDGTKYKATEGNFKFEEGVLKPEKDAKAEVTVGETTSTIVGLKGESEVRVLGEGEGVISFSGRDFSVSRAGDDGYSAEVNGNGGVGTKKGLNGYEGAKAIVGKVDDAKNVDFRGGGKEKGEIVFKPESDDWTYSKEGMNGDVPAGKSGELRYNNKGEGEVDVLRADGSGATAMPSGETNPRVQTDPLKPGCGPNGCFDPAATDNPGEGEGSGSRGGGGGGLVEAIKAIGEALAGLKPQEKTPAEPLPENIDGRSQGGGLGEDYNPIEDVCVNNGVEGFDCPGGDCSKCQFDLSGIV